MATTTLMKRLLSEIDTQKTPLWMDYFSKYPFTEIQARNLLSYMESTRKHRELMNEYFPSKNKTEYHKVMDAAMRVGLQLPKTFSDALGEESIVDKPSVGFTAEEVEEKKEATG